MRGIDQAMRRYVPKTYNNRRFLRIIFRTVIAVAVAFLVLFIVLFFWMQPYYKSIGGEEPKLELPWLVDESPPP